MHERDAKSKGVIAGPFHLKPAWSQREAPEWSPNLHTAEEKGRRPVPLKTTGILAANDVRSPLVEERTGA